MAASLTLAKKGEAGTYGQLFDGKVDDADALYFDPETRIQCVDMQTVEKEASKGWIKRTVAEVRTGGGYAEATENFDVIGDSGFVLFRGVEDKFLYRVNFLSFFIHLWLKGVLNTEVLKKLTIPIKTVVGYKLSPTNTELTLGVEELDRKIVDVQISESKAAPAAATTATAAAAAKDPSKPVKDPKPSPAVRLAQALDQADALTTAGRFLSVFLFCDLLFSF